MSDKTKIEWTDATWNPVVGCSIVSPGCHNCYAMRMAKRVASMGDGESHRAYRRVLKKDSVGELLPHWNGDVQSIPSALSKPLKWTRPRRIFVCSMSDLFHYNVPDSWIDAVFAVMAQSPQHTFQVLTKRPQRAARYLENLQMVAASYASRVGSDRFTASSLLSFRWLTHYKLGSGFGNVPWPLPNVWLGTSIESQAYDDRLEHLLQCPAAVRFVSAEPLLGPLDLGLRNWAAVDRDGPHRDDCRLDWVIAGGESGPNARPMHPDWPRFLQQDCEIAGVPFFFKQWGEWYPLHGTGRPSRDEFQEHTPYTWISPATGKTSSSGCEPDALMLRLGKKTAGRVLDGRIYDEFPAMELSHAITH